MGFPTPTQRQAGILWSALTALSIAIILAVVGGISFLLKWGLTQLSPVLLPIAVAGIIAFLLDPVVDFIQTKGIPRTRAIILVFFMAVSLVIALLVSVGPQLTTQAQKLYGEAEYNADRLIKQAANVEITPPTPPETEESNDAEKVDNSLSFVGEMFEKVNQIPLLEDAAERLKGVLVNLTGKIMPSLGRWLTTQMEALMSWVGLMIGMALAPVYAFYFLLEKDGISKNWERFLPIPDSDIKKEVAFVIKAINEHLIVFFRGQVLVAMCVGGLLPIWFSIIGLHHAIISAVIAGVAGIVPYLGVMISILPALTIAFFQQPGWLLPALVIIIFILVQMAEGLFISPKIIGDRVGLHPLTIIIAVMIGTALMGGIIGGILAIPLTASLKVLMFRYVWTSQQLRPAESPAEKSS